MHPILACKKIPDLLQIVLIGFYPKEEMESLDTAFLSREVGVPVTYLQEEGGGHGSAGGLYQFKETLLEGNPKYIFVLNADVCSDCPLHEMLKFHRAHAGSATMLVKEVDAQSAKDHGEVVLENQGGGKVLHYAEKPTTLVSSTVNCGIYVFTAPGVFETIRNLLSQSLSFAKYPIQSLTDLSVSDKNTQTSTKAWRKDPHVCSLQPKLGMPEVFSALAEQKSLYAYRTRGFWKVLKTPGSSLKFSELYLSQMGSKLAQARAKLKGGPQIEGNVYIHPGAEVHPSAKIGPNVAIESGVTVEAGVRLKDCIILDDVQVEANACIMNSIIGWGSIIGPWARIQGSPDYDSKMGVTILAENVSVGSQVVVVSSIILPHKEIKSTVKDEIVL